MAQNGQRTLVVDIEMLKRYDKPGPRYTSYPTAPNFTTGFDAAAFKTEIERTNQSDRSPDLSLYFHLPFCDTLCYYCGCTTIITRNHDRIDEYLNYIIKEVEFAGRLIKPGRKVAQLHWGGGTPTSLDPEQIRRLFAAIRENFAFYADAEVSVEIDPRGMTDAHLDALEDVGFNRASIGVQDFDPNVQQAINRLQSEELTRWACDGFRARGFESINLDLIYGLPHQTVYSFEKTLERIINLAPDRLAVYSYAHVPWMKKHQNLISEEALPGPEAKLNILKATIERLTSAGYAYIGMDHFAKPDDALTQALDEKKLYRNFQGYSTKSGCDLYAFGMSSISQLEDVYAQNVKSLPAYYQAIDASRFATERGYRLSADDHIRRFVITSLMCHSELRKQDVEKRFDITFDDYFAEALEKMEPMALDGLVEMPNGTIHVTETGRLLVRNIAMAFDKYLGAMEKQNAPTFSQTV